MNNQNTIEIKEQIRLLMHCPKAYLGSSARREENIFPSVSLVIPALRAPDCLLLLLSDLSDHVRNLSEDPKASLLFDGTEGYDEPLTGPRVTILGQVVVTTDSEDRQSYLAQRPAAALYADFADFRFYRFTPREALLVAGFGRIHRLTAAEMA